MYHFIFAWMYLYHKKGGDTIYKHVASYAVAVVIFFNVLFLLNCFERIFEINVEVNKLLGDNKLIIISSVVLYLIITDLVYFKRERINRILSTYPLDYRLHTVKNYTKFFFIFFLPLGLWFWLIR